MTPGGLPILRIRQLVDREAEPDFFDGAVEPRFKVANGDLIFSWSATLATDVWDRGPAVLNQHLFNVHPVPGVEKRWLRRAIEASIPVFAGMMHGSAMTHITREMLRDVKVQLPTLDDQRRIADFLDAEVMLHNRARALLRQRVDLAREIRTAHVLHEVTGAEKATSSDRLPWSQRVAPDWTVAKITHVAKLGSGHTPSRGKPEWWLDCTVPWVTTGEVQQLRDDRLEVITETRESLSLLGIANSSAEIHPTGTVVLSRTASAGFSAVMGRPMATSQDYVTWTCGPRLRPLFLLWCLRAMRPDLLGRLAMGSTHKTIYVPDIQTIRIPIPTVGAQDQAVAAVQRVNAHVDAGIDLIERQLALIEERQHALIAAAVTGKFDVTTARTVA